MANSKTINSAIRDQRVSCIALALAALTPAPAFAQASPAPSPTADDKSDTQEVVVTGSRVRGEAPVGSTVISIGRVDLERSGEVTVDRIIKQIPQNFDLGVSENSRGQSGGSGNITYGNSVNLRGIGPYATLVLIDGHRATSNSRSIDPSVLPSLGVERVEVVADGASAIYGSDAVAGVVNLIPRRSLNGGEAYARSGVATQGGFQEYAFGAAYGKVFDRGQIMVAYEHVERSNLSGDDRAFFTSNQVASGGPDGRTTRCNPGTIRAGTTTYAIPATGVTQATAGTLVAGTTNRCELFRGQDLIPRQNYDTVNLTGTIRPTDWLTLSIDAFYSQRNFYRRSAISSATITLPQTNAFFVRPAGFTGASYTLDYMFNELPVNDSYGYARSWQVTPKLKIKLPHDFEFEALAGYGKTNDLSSAINGINNAALNTALASNDPTQAFDPYGLGRTNTALYANLANQIFIAPTNGRLQTYEARLNGTLFTLPGGPVKLATGYEHQDFMVDLGSARGGPTTPIIFRSFGRKVDSVYGEIYLPLFGDGNAIPAFQKLEVNAAVRYDKYSDVGATTNPKFGVNWVPLRGFKVRGSYGTSFRAPTIPEIYGNSNNLFVQNYSNPTGGSIIGVALSGANPNLRPETASTWSVGADIEPIRNLRLGLTYWEVDYRNQVQANLSNLAILGSAALYNGTNILFQGAAAGAQVQSYINAGIGVVGTLPGGSAANVTVFVDGRSQNLAVSITHGIDFTVDYRVDVTSQDILSFDFNGSYLTDYKFAVTPTAPQSNLLNTIFNPLRLKARATVAWDHGPLGARLLWTHVNGYTNTAAIPAQNVRSYNPIDLALTWRIGDRTARGFFQKGLTFSLEARNLFDENPPYVNIAPGANGSGGYDATASDPVGRRILATIRKSF
jgi:iron complex outermembrane receptor protein